MARVVTDPTDLRSIVECFYTTERLGAAGLSDGGGPFGFDITVALQIHALLVAFECDGVVETGTFLGDTASYLARRYPHLPVRTIESDPTYGKIARRRLDHPNCTVIIGDSGQVLPEALTDLERPLVFLDAHWGDSWPLKAELAAVSRGVACVHDFDIGHPRFGYDTYGGVACDVDLLHSAAPDVHEILIGNPFAEYGVPCLQVGRRAGVAYVVRGLDTAVIAGHPWFVPVRLDAPAPSPPIWPDADASGAG